jgi:hypothetical protein
MPVIHQGAGNTVCNASIAALGRFSTYCSLNPGPFLLPSEIHLKSI